MVSWAGNLHNGIEFAVIPNNPNFHHPIRQPLCCNHVPTVSVRVPNMLILDRCVNISWSRHITVTPPR